MPKTGSRRKAKSTTDVTRLEESLFDLSDMITLPEAMDMCRSQGFDFNRPFMIRMITRYEIGAKVGGRWFIWPNKMALLFAGKLRK